MMARTMEAAGPLEGHSRRLPQWPLSLKGQRR